MNITVRSFFTIVLIGCLLSALPVFAAKDFRIILPIGCTPGMDCWVVNYIDMDPADDIAADFTCGSETYDKHEGIDFAVRDLNALKSGVGVLAASDGKVLRVRDGMVDRLPTANEIEKMLVENQGCGNGVLIDHGDGWQSIYCHLKQGSAIVKPGDNVTAGQRIAEAGHSGAAEFPHLHFGLFHNNRTIDPFSGAYADEGCGVVKGALWLEGINVIYEPFSIFATGFTTTVPDFDKIRNDTSSPRKTTPAIDVLAFWAGLYGLREGDIIRMDIVAPDNSVYTTRTITQDKNRARQFYYVGKRIGDPLLPGPYQGILSVERPIGPGKAERLYRGARTEIIVANPVTDPAVDEVDGFLAP